jgi:hypothetical protein
VQQQASNRSAVRRGHTQQPPSAHPGRHHARRGHHAHRRGHLEAQQWQRQRQRQQWRQRAHERAWLLQQKQTAPRPTASACQTAVRVNALTPGGMPGRGIMGGGMPMGGGPVVSGARTEEVTAGSRARPAARGCKRLPPIAARGPRASPMLTSHAHGWAHHGRCGDLGPRHHHARRRRTHAAPRTRQALRSEHGGGAQRVWMRVSAAGGGLVRRRVGPGKRVCGGLSSVAATGGGAAPTALTAGACPGTPTGRPRPAARPTPGPACDRHRHDAAATPK